MNWPSDGNSTVRLHSYQNLRQLGWSTHYAIERMPEAFQVMVMSPPFGVTGRPAAT